MENIFNQRQFYFVDIKNITKIFLSKDEKQVKNIVLMTIFPVFIHFVVKNEKKISKIL